MGCVRLERRLSLVPTNPVIGFAGLKTSGNPLSRPPGSASRADNVMSIEQGVTQPRRGHWNGENTFGDSNDRAWAITEFDGGLVIHYGPESGGTGDTIGVATTPTGTWTSLGAFAALDPDEQRLKFAQMAKSLYWNSSGYLAKLTGTSAASLQAGKAQPGDFAFIGIAGAPNASGSWMTSDTAVAYRALIGRKDANNVVQLGAPCGRSVCVNPADLTIPIGGLVRSGGNAVTVTPTLSPGQYVQYSVGDTFTLTLTPADANFADGNYTVATVAADGLSFVYASVGANVSNANAGTITSGYRYVAPIVYLPTGMGITAGDFVQLYRTEMSTGSRVDPGDEEFLCYERTLTATDISNKYVQITDTTPEAFLGQPLYTNANTGNGAASAHIMPPLMADMCVFDGRLFGAQTQGPQQVSFRLLGIGSPNGLQSGDKIAVGGVVFTLTTVPIYASLTQSIQYICAYIAALLNYTGSDFHATQTANGILPSGNLIVTRRSLTADEFAIGTSRVSAWEDPLGLLISVSSASRTSNVVTVNTGSAHGFSVGQKICFAEASGSSDANFPVGVKTVASVVDSDTFTYAETGSDSSLGAGTFYVHAATTLSSRLEKQVRFSEPGEPEAWPISNFLGGLPDGRDVLRIASLRGNLYIFFSHGDIYVCSGAYPYTVQKFDGTATLMAPDSLVEHAGRLLALTTQGIVAVSESGAEPLSLDIEEALRIQMSDAESMLRCFGVSYEMDRQYQCWMGSGDVGCDLAYVLQSNARLWSKFVCGRTCGLAIKNTTDGEQLVFGSADENLLRFEHKSYDRHDFVDDEFDFVGGEWSIDAEENTVNFLDIHGVASNDIWAVDVDGFAWHYDGTWNQVDPSIGSLNSVWMVATNDVWVGGNSGAVAHWNGSTWTPGNVGVSEYVYGLTATATNNVWASCSGGYIRHWNGSAWANVASGSIQQLAKIRARTASDIWAVGTQGEVLRWNGVSWNPVASGVVTDLYDVWPIGVNDVFIVGASGVIRHWNGTSFSASTSHSTALLTGIYGIASNDIWVCGRDGALIHWDGSAWSVSEAPDTRDFTAIWGAATDDFWAVGVDGVIAHGPLTTTIQCGQNTGEFVDSSGLGFDGIDVGDLIVPSVDTTKPGWVTAVSGNTLSTDSELYSPNTFTTLTVGKPITPLALKWLAIGANAPGIEKQWSQGQLHFGQRCIDAATVNTTGEREDTPQDVTLDIGDSPTVQAAEVLSTERWAVPKETNRQAMLEVELELGTRAGQYFRLLGVSLTGEAGSERTPKGGG